MNSIFSYFKGLVRSSAQISYEPVGTAKNEDSDGNEAIQEWLFTHEVEPGMDQWSHSEVEKFVTNFIKDLPKDQLTDTGIKQLTEANIKAVEQRFKELSKESGRARTCLCEKFKNKDLRKIDKAFRTNLAFAVIGSFPTKI